MRSFFVSSTFKDMQAERDIIYQRVFPSIRRRLQKYGEDIQQLDLRWGVDTSIMSEKESGYYVIQTCIDAIDNCRPYIIVLIGERYGWIPEESDIKKLNDERVACLCNEPISITQMEILYGALESGDISKCIFCFRDEQFSKQIPEKCRARYAAESEMHQKKLTHLKSRIKALSGVEIMEYSPVWNEDKECIGGLDSFAAELETLVWNMLEREFEKYDNSPEQRIIDMAKLTVKRHMAAYAKRSDLDSFNAVLYSRWFFGESGIGKSAFLASLYDNAEQLDFYDVFIYFSENPNCDKTDTFINTLYYWLCKKTASHMAYKAVGKMTKINAISVMLAKKTDKNLLILIDGAERLNRDCIELIGSLNFGIIRNSGSSSIVVSSSKKFYEDNKKFILQNEFSENYYQEIKALDRNGIQFLVQRHAQYRGKRIDVATVNAIINKNCGNPFYLTLVMQRLFMMNGKDFEAAEAFAPGMEGISLYMQNIIKAMPSDIDNMILDVLKNAAEKITALFIGNGFDKSVCNAVPKIIQLLSFAEKGFKISEFQDLFGAHGIVLSTVVFQQLFSFLYIMISEDAEGYFYFVRPEVANIVKSTMSDDEKKNIYALLAEQMLKENRPDKSFEYALKSADRNLIIMSAEAVSGNKTEYGRTFIEYLNQDGIGDAESIIDTNIFAQLVVNSVFMDSNTALANHNTLRRTIKTLQERSDISKKNTFMLAAADMFFAKINYKDEFDRSLDVFLRTYNSLENPGKEEKERLCYGILNIMTSRMFIAYANQLCSEMTDLIKTDMSIGKEKGLLLQIVILLTFHCVHKEPYSDEDILQLKTNMSALLGMMSITDGYKKLKKELNKIIDFHRNIIAENYIKSKQFNKAAPIIKEAVRSWEERHNNDPSPDTDEVDLYAGMFLNWADNVKAEYRAEYTKSALEQYKKIVVITDLKGYITKYMDTVAKHIAALENKGDKKLDYEEKVSLEAAYDEFVKIFKSRYAAENDMHMIYTYLYLLYMRVTRRLKGDIWMWRDEIGLNKEHYDRQMHEDLQDLIFYEKKYYSNNRSYENLLNLAFDHLYALQYYDFHQETERVPEHAEQIMMLVDKILDEPTHKEDFVRVLGFCTTAAESCERIGFADKAKQYAAVGVSVLKEAESENLNKIKVRQYAARLYIVLMKTPAAACEVADYTDKAYGFINGTTSMPDEYCYLECDILYTLAKMHLSYNEQDSAIKLLDRAVVISNKKVRKSLEFTDKEGVKQTYFIDIKLNTPSKDEEKIQHYFLGLNAGIMLAFLKKDKTAADDIMACYKEIAEEYTSDGDSAKRPLLLTQVKKAHEEYVRIFGCENSDAKFILLLNMNNRAEALWEDMFRQTHEIFLRIKRLEQEGIYTSKYFELMKEYCEKWTTSYKERNVTRIINGKIDKEQYFLEFLYVSKAVRDYYLNEGDIKSAFWAQYDISHLYPEYEKNNNIHSGRYRGEEKYNDWFGIKKYVYTLSRKYVHMGVNMLRDLVVDGCCESFSETKDFDFMEKALHEVDEYQKHITVEENNAVTLYDKEYYKEVYAETLIVQNDLYLFMGDNGGVSEEIWFKGYIAGLDRLLNIDIPYVNHLYRELLEELYKIKEYNINDKLTLQRRIEKLIDLIGNGDNMMFYISKAIKDNKDADIEQIINSMKDYSK